MCAASDCKLDGELSSWMQTQTQVKNRRESNRSIDDRVLYRVDRLPAADRRTSRRSAVTAENYLGEVAVIERATKTNIERHRAYKQRTGVLNPVLKHP